MTQTLQRPPRPSPPPRATGAPLRTAALLGLRSALTAGALGLLAVALPVLLLGAVDDRAGAGWADTLRTAGQLWLVANGGDLEVSGAGYGLTPLGLAALPVWLLLRAGRPDGPGGPVRRALTVAVPYAAGTALVALMSATDSVRAPVLRAAIGALVLATCAVVLGGWSRLAVPERVRGTGRAVLAAYAVLLGAGSLLAGTALALHLPRAADLADASAPGVIGGAGLLLVGLSLVPNAALWGASWLAGPGFAVGAGTAVGPFGHELGNVPALPLLAALPGSAAPGWVGPLALLVPVLAGALAGRLVQRNRPGASGVGVTREAALVGVGAGAVWAVLAWLSGGPVGGARLVEVGPGPWSVGLAVAATVAAGAVVSALAHRWRARP